MTINLSNDGAIDPENFVIRIFDGIKCAAATGNMFRLYLNQYETIQLAEEIKKVNWIEINQED